MITWQTDQHIAFGFFTEANSAEITHLPKQPISSSVELDSLYCIGADKHLSKREFQQFLGGIGGEFSVACDACKKQDTFQMHEVVDNAHDAT